MLPHMSGPLCMGLKYNQLKILNNMVLEPMILYGCAVSYPALRRGYNDKLLHDLQRLIAIRVVIRGYRTTSYDSAILIAGMTPRRYKAEALSVYHAECHGKVFAIEDRLLKLDVCVTPYDHPHPAAQAPVLAYELAMRMANSTRSSLRTDLDL
ncbi:Uncharacterised protein at_DN0840 [Pycnogonum litorale]